MENVKKKITEDDLLAALLKVKPTPGMPRPGKRPSRPKIEKINKDK